MEPAETELADSLHWLWTDDPVMSNLGSVILTELGLCPIPH